MNYYSTLFFLLCVTLASTMKHGAEGMAVNPKVVTARTSVYNLADPMLKLCSFIRPFVDLRREAKFAILKFAKERDDLKGKDFYELREIFEAYCNGDLLSSDGNECSITEESLQTLTAYFEILSLPKTAAQVKDDCIKYWSKFPLKKEDNIGNKEFLEAEANKDDSYIYYIDDEHTLPRYNCELTYAIVVSDSQKTITVIFRGSKPIKSDWMANLRLRATDLVLPGYTADDDLSSNQDRKTFGRVHKGYYDYLFGKTEVKGISKGENVMMKLKELWKEKEGYDLYITGHSLGGAVSTMMAFRAAALDELKGARIINVSFASPFVGDQGFREQFQMLEKKNKLQHLRVTNNNDFVPRWPYRTFLPPILMFKHTGVNVKLYQIKKNRVPHVSYPNGRFVNEIRNAVDTNLFRPFRITHHQTGEYITRIAHAKSHLEKLMISDFYENEKFTGWTKD